MRTTFRKAFIQFVIKASKPLQLATETKVAEVCDNPRLGQQKLGDLHAVEKTIRFK
jgi:hypothetical protein